jgi:hypothetical protein
MELEMYLDGKFIDSISITAAQLKNIHELQHQMEKKHCHSLEYSDDQPQFFISGLNEEDTEVITDASK